MRESQLVESDDVTTIDAADLKAAADRRAVAILDKKIKALSVRLWREECDRLEVDRAKAIKKITGIYARRTAKGARAEELLAELAAVILDIRADSEACSAAWKLGGLPSWFTWRHDVVADLMPSMYKALGDLMPSNVRRPSAFTHTADLPATPRRCTLLRHRRAMFLVFSMPTRKAFWKVCAKLTSGRPRLRPRPTPM